MSFKLSKKGGGDFVPHPETDGLIRAVIVDVTEPKKVQTQWGEQDKFRLVYESEIMDEANKRPFCIWSMPYTTSLNEKANFRKDLKKMRGHDLTKDEEEEFDPETLIGHAVQIIVKHEQVNDKTFANISHIQPHKGANPLKPSGKFVRERDRKKDGESASYRQASGSGDDDAPSREDWQKTKVHVGRNKGLDLGDLEQEAVQNLLDKWLPEFRKNTRPTADDRRLAAALEEAAKLIGEPAY